MSHRVTIASLIALLSACSSMPDSSEAQAAYEAHRATIDDVDRVLRASSRPLFRPWVICEDADELARLDDAARNIAFEACHARHNAERDAWTAEWNRFRGVPLTLLESHPDILGLDVSISTLGSPRRYHTGVGVSGTSRPGVPAARGFGRGDRAIGYHLYQTAMEFTLPGRGRVAVGDGEHRPGLEVVWTFGAQTSSIRITLAVLTEDETTPSWRAAQRARLVAAGVRLPAAPRATASP